MLGKIERKRVGRRLRTQSGGCGILGCLEFKPLIIYDGRKEG